MKNIWMLTVLFAVAGCQPDVQENPAASPASVLKSDVQVETAPAAILSKPQKESAQRVVLAPNTKPVQPKAPPAKLVVKPAADFAPVAVTPVPIAGSARIEKTVATEPVSVSAAAPQMQLSEADAMALAKKKNCFACHALDKKVVGPAWKTVAEKYRGDAGAQAALESKVRKGGKGNWGSIAMPPQSALSDEELNGLVRFVLQLK